MGVFHLEVLEACARDTAIQRGARRALSRKADSATGLGGRQSLRLSALVLPVPLSPCPGESVVSGTRVAGAGCGG